MGQLGHSAKFHESSHHRLCDTLVSVHLHGFPTFHLISCNYRFQQFFVDSSSRTLFSARKKLCSEILHVLGIRNEKIAQPIATEE